MFKKDVSIKKYPQPTASQVNQEKRGFNPPKTSHPKPPSGTQIKQK